MRLRFFSCAYGAPNKSANFKVEVAASKRDGAGDRPPGRCAPCALRGQRDEAYRVLARLDAMPASGALLFAEALIHVGLGELDRALDLLERAVEDRPWQMQLLGVEPAYDPLRPNPRFQVLLETLGLGG